VAGTDYTLINAGSASGFSSSNVALGTAPVGLKATLQVTSDAVILRVSPDSSSGGGAVSP